MSIRFCLWLAAATGVLLSGCAGTNAETAWQPLGLCGGGGLFNPSISPHDPSTILAESDMGGRYISRDGGRNWTMYHFKEMAANCRQTAPMFHPTKPGVIYALHGGSSQRLQMSVDNGRTWQPIEAARQPQSDVAAMYIDPLRPDRFFVGSGGGQVTFTEDEGKTWQKASGVEGQVLKFLAKSDSSKENRTYFVGTSKGVFRSDDGGKTFARKAAGLPEGGLTGFAGGSRGGKTVLYAATACVLKDEAFHGGMYVSKDGGESWQRCMNPKINVQTARSSQWAAGDLPRYSHLVACDADPDVAYVYCASTSYFPPNHSTIYRTSDAGASWSEVWFVDPRFKECNAETDYQSNFLRQSFCARPIHMTICPTDANRVIRADAMYMFQTADGGKTWQCSHAAKATDGPDDKDVTWRVNGLVCTTAWNYYIDPHEPRRHYIAYTDIGLARSLDAGKTWRWWGPARAPGEEGTRNFPIPSKWVNTCYEMAFDPAVPGRIWGAFSMHHDIPNENSIWTGTGRSSRAGGVCVSNDFGVTWTAAKGLPEAPALSVVIDPKSPVDKRTLYASIYDHGVFKSTDGGQTWVKKSQGLGDESNLRVTRLQVHPDGTLFVLVTGMRIPANGPFTSKGVGLWRSGDGGETWQRVNESHLFLYPRDFAVDPADSRIAYVGASDCPGAPANQGGLYGTRDGGKTWQLLLRKRPTHFGAYIDPHHKGWIYATAVGWSYSSEGGLWLSKDEGNTWKAVDAMPFCQVQRVSFDPKDPAVIYVSTFGASVWKGPAGR